MDTSNISRNLSRLLFGLIAALILVYAGLRAIRLSFTFDEAATYFFFISSKVFYTIDFTDANNHLLYTLLARLFSEFGGTRELVLRLPSLIGLVLYLTFSWKIFDRFFGRAAGLAGFLVLNLNPYVLDFFSLGRGYGLALGLEMAALYFFLVYLDSARGGRPDSEPPLEASLLAGCAAAMTNIAFLNVLMSQWAFLLFYFLITSWNSRNNQTPSSVPENGAPPGRRWVAAAMVLAVPFNLIAVGQSIRLSRVMLEPVAVRIDGLDEKEARHVIVSGDDTYDREIEFTYEDGAWGTSKVIPLRRLKLGVRDTVLQKIRLLDVAIGARRFRFHPPEMRDWKRFPREGLEFFLSDIPAARTRSVFGDMNEVMNWKGDGVFFRAYAVEAAAVLALGTLVIALVFGLGRLAVGQRLLRSREWRPLRDSIGLTAFYLCYPIYIMKTSGALYYGGERGFFKDTVGSLISGSFYAVRYGARQENVALAFILGTIVLAVLIFGVRRVLGKKLTEHGEALSLLALMVIAALLVIAQRAVFRNPYLLGRTALFYVPLFSLFFLFFLRDVGRLGGAWRPAASVLLAAAVVFSAVHGVRAANLTHTLDWPYDADTKQMIRDVTAVRSDDLAERPRLRLGLDWHFWPSSEYYRRTNRLDWLDISMLPTPRRCDLYYLLPDIPRVGTGAIIKRYPRTGNILTE